MINIRPPLWFLLSLAILNTSGATGDERAVVVAASGSRFQPGSAQSLGTLRVAKGESLTFDTGGAGSTPTVSGVVNADGTLGRSESGKVELALFAFDTIDLAEGAEISVTGSRGLVLLTTGAIVIDTSLDLSGGDGQVMERAGKEIADEVIKRFGNGLPTGYADVDFSDPKSKGSLDRHLRRTVMWHNAAKGGPGAEGGIRGESFQSAPPPLSAGAGAPAAKDWGFSGIGYGGGYNVRCRGGAAGSGGGYGGRGGDTSPVSSGMFNKGGVRPFPGGVTYGDPQLTDLFGGSGAGGGSNDRQFNNGGGGAGGGVLSLVSNERIVLGAGGRLLAKGGNGAVSMVCGGGGSGGAILLAAPTIDLADGAIVDVRGGDGGSAEGVKEELAERVKPSERDPDQSSGRINKGSGGGGGGGRVAFFADRVLRNSPGQVLLRGGKGGAEASDGADGSFFSGKL